MKLKEIFETALPGVTSASSIATARQGFFSDEKPKKKNKKQKKSIIIKRIF